MSVIRVYRVSFHDADEGVMVSWHHFRGDAEAKLREHQNYRRDVLQQDPQGIEEVRECRITTTKVGLIEWLNINFTRSNG